MDMPTRIPVQWSQAAAREKRRLAAGETPPPRIKNPQQRAAAKALAGFFSLMLLLTVLSRAAYGATVARVEVGEAKTGILNQRVTVGGSIEAEGDLPITLPGGIEVLRVVAEKGQRVQAGDVLLELDQEGLESSLEKLRNDRKLLDLRIEAAGQGNTGESTAALLSAPERVQSAEAALRGAAHALATAREDHERLVQSRETTESREAEDVAQARADVEKAEAELEKAQGKAKEALEKAAQEKVEAARETLETLEESAAEEKAAAQEALDVAREQQSSAGDVYWDALEAGERADRLVEEAQAALDKLMESGDDEQAIAAAQAALSQAQSVKLQLESRLSSLSAANDSASQALKRAREALKKTTEKWEKELAPAREKLEKAEAELAEIQEKTDMSEEPLVISAQAALDSARRALRSAERMEEDTRVSTEDQLRSSLRAIGSAEQAVDSAKRNLDSAQRGVESARRQMENERKNNETARRQAEIDRLGYLIQRQELAESILALEEAAAAGGVVTAPIPGTVLSILEEPGKTQEGARAVLLSRSDLGFQFVGKVGEKEAGTLSPGDEGVLSFQQDGKRREVRAVISGLGMADEKGQVSVLVQLEGSFPTGVSASLEISKRSGQYNTCLPVGALRSESGGEYFVLVMREKTTVMGKEQTAEKIPVKVLDKDSELAAVEAPMLQREDRVIVSSSKPIGEGDRVRETE